MTLRLVGLMSVVLLLSLASFGLLVAHYQDEVMEEVERTASAVGRETLRTLELPGATGQARMLLRQAAGAEPGEPRTATLRQYVVLRSDSGPGSKEVREEVREFVTRLDAATAPAGDGTAKDVVSTTCTANFVSDVFIDVEEVHAERIPAQGRLVMRIPTLAQGGEGQAAWVPATGAAQDLEFPIPLGDFEGRFAELRRRSMLMFLGVFVVGSVLTAGVAARFTRPIRRLDGALRRLAAGDLEARVEPHGRDEIGRLGAAFNDMAGRLRAGRDREREMLRREKLTALGGLAAGVAHDVRNPLHSIGLALQHMRETCRPEGTERAEEFDRALDVIRGEIRRLDQLVVNFLRFARSDRRERRPVELGELLRETERLVHKEAERRGVETVLDLGTVPSVSADGEALRSSVLNLVLNAFDAMPDGGRLTLSLGVAGDAATIQVADTGHGIPAEDHERVFEFAYTTREGGNGLGLAMVRHTVVEEHGGRVTLDSAPGKGTRVTLAIPIRAAETEPA